MTARRHWPWLLLVMVCEVQAALSLGGTRLVLVGREASLELHNAANREALVQAWLTPATDDQAPGGADPQSALPFVVTPALVRLPAHGRQLLRVLYHGQGMPTGRESLLHLYVLEVPRRGEAAQQLSIAVRQRINLFYRPPGLPGDPAAAVTGLRWSWRQAGDGPRRLRVDNPTAFHVVLLDLKAGSRLLQAHRLLAPGQTAEWTASGPAARRLSFRSLTDYGGQRSYCVRLTEQVPARPRLSNSPSFMEDC